MIHEGLFKRVGQTIWLLIEEEPEGGGVTDDTYSKRYALFWSVLAAHYIPPFFEKTRPRV